MTTKALSLVEEFIRSPQPQLRKNALTALAVINEPEAIDLMTYVALQDADAGVRQRAEDELVGLDSLDGAITEAQRTLWSTDEETQQRAYAFLGRLRSKSASVFSADIPWRRVMKLAARMNAYLYPKRNWRFRMRLWKPGLLGIVLGSIFPIAVALWIWFVPNVPRAERMIGLGVGLTLVLLVGVPLIVFVGQRAAPIYRHPNRFAAGVVETTTTGFLGLVSVTPIFLLVLIWQWLNSGFSLGSLFIPLMGLMVGFVRAGTALSLGLYWNRWSNRFVEVMLGAAFGSLAFTIGAFLIVVATPDLTPDLQLAIWMLHLPLAFGAANAFASVDKEALPDWRLVLRDPWRRWRGLMLLGAFVLSVGLNISMLKRIAIGLHFP